MNETFPFLRVGDVSGAQASPVDLTAQMLKRRSERSEGGQIVQELIVGSCLDSENARGGDAERAEARRVQQGPNKVVLARDGEELHQDKGTYECPNIRSRGVSWEYNTGDPGLTCEGSETRQPRGSVV